VWHLVFHYSAKLRGMPELPPGVNIAAAEWFPLDALPAAADVAHHGWALEVIPKVVDG
jgi:hypothetical protein